MFCQLCSKVISYTYTFVYIQASLVAQMGKNLPAMWEAWVGSLGWEDPPRGGYGNPLQYSCLENPHGQRSLAGYSPRGHKELDVTERQSTVHIHLRVYLCVCTPGIE